MGWFGGGAKRILLVDDDPSLCEMLSALLKDEGFAVDTAADGVEGVRAFQAAKYDLVVLDGVMPNLDGFGALQTMRAVPGKEKVPILMLTVMNNTGRVADAFDKGATDYLAKPVDFPGLVSRIKSLLA